MLCPRDGHHRTQMLIAVVEEAAFLVCIQPVVHLEVAFPEEAYLACTQEAASPEVAYQASLLEEPSREVAYQV